MAAEEVREGIERLTTEEDGSGRSSPITAPSVQQVDESGRKIVSVPGTVFSDPENFSIKHPLQNSWTLWYDNPGKKASQDTWELSLKKVYTFNTVEDFWALFNQIKPTSKLGHGANYHLFKDGIEPKWEDIQNQNGGKWVVTLPKAKRESMDQLWLHLILALIGETFPDSNEICGAVTSVRKANDRLALWTRNTARPEATKDIGRQLKEVLNMGAKETVGYQVHKDSIKQNRSFSNRPKYEV